MNIFKVFLKIGSITMVSRVLGFIRDILHTAFLGATPVSDAFIIAFKFPNFFRRLFAEGAFNASFVPIFSGIFTNQGLQPALQFAEYALALLISMLIGITLLAELFMPQIIAVLAPGFLDDAEQFSQVVNFARITFPYLFFISLTALYSGVLNSLDHFSAPAAAPILLNFCLISALLLYGTSTGTNGYALSTAVSIAGVMQLTWLILYARAQSIRLKLKKPKLTSETKQLLIKMAPIALSGGVFQINIMIDTLLASFLPDGSISYLYFADRLSELPLGVIGVALGTALLPMLSKAIKSNNTQLATTHQNKAIVAALLFGLPAAIALFVISEPIILALFGRGEFTTHAVHQTSLALTAYSLGIPAFIFTKIYTTSFFAYGDTKTPLKIAIFTVVLNLVLNIILMQFLYHVGLALSTTITSWVQVLISYAILKNRGWFSFNAFTKQKSLPIVASSLIMGAYLYGTHYFIADWFADVLTIKILAISILVLGGIIFYFLSLHFMKAFRISDLKKLLRSN
jgi:putative peptidoglycan lipid II flippase